MKRTLIAVLSLLLVAGAAYAEPKAEKDETAQDDVWKDNPDAVIASSFPGKDATVKEVEDGWIADGTVKT